MPPKPYYSPTLGLDYRHRILQFYKGFTRLSLEPYYYAFIQGSSNSLVVIAFLWCSISVI